MDINKFFKSVIDADSAPVVICDLNDTVVYMNPVSVERYKTDLTGKSIMDCHNKESCDKIARVVKWFAESEDNNVVFTTRVEREDCDVYMVALRDDDGRLIGYYEKHECRKRHNV